MKKKRNETSPGQNRICFLAKIMGPRWLEQILTVPSSWSQRSFTVYISIFIISEEHLDPLQHLDHYGQRAI
jgi:hypothetical protein